MYHRSGALQLSSLKSVYQSLTTNAKGIFKIIIEYQLENQKQAHYQGNCYNNKAHVSSVLVTPVYFSIQLWIPTE